MGKQVNFFLTPEDLVECLTRIQKRGPIVIFKTLSPDNRPDIIPPERYGQLHEVDFSLGLARPEDLDKVVFRYVPQQEYFSLDEDHSLAIELSQCKVRGSIMKRGRLYYQPSFYKGDCIVEKDADFIAWAQSALRVAVRGLNKDPVFGSSYIGPQAEHRYAEGVLQLAQF